MKVHRGVWLALLMLVMSGLVPPAAAPARGGAKDVRVREDADELLKPQNKAKLDALKLAFQSLGDPNDKTSKLHFWANIHGAPFGETATGPCEHKNEVIWPWHRAYLYEFETELRKTNPGKTDDVTLPYWDWTAPPSGKRYPKIFEDPGSPLNYKERLTDPFPGPPVDSDTETKLLGISDWETFAGPPKPGATEGAMENGPHDTVHVFIGKHNNSTARSARDPLFWAHHANLDRIWLAWQEKYKQNPVGQDEPIRGFPGMKVKDWNDVSTKYRYGPKVNPALQDRGRTFHELFTARLARGRVPGAAFRADVPVLGANDRLVLRLKDVYPPEEGPHIFTGEVYLHPKGADPGCGAVSEYFLTQFGFWDSAHDQHNKGGKHAAGTDLLLDVTARGRELLKAAGNRELVLTVRFIGVNEEGQPVPLAADGKAGVRVGRAEFQARAVPAKKSPPPDK
jgi:hypothetical protein